EKQVNLNYYDDNSNDSTATLTPTTNILKSKAASIELNQVMDLQSNNLSSSSSHSNTWRTPDPIDLPPLSEMITSPLSYIVTVYNWLSSFADPRVADWPLMSSPLPTLILFTLYLTGVKYGPGIMQNKRPWRLRWILVAYNLSISMLNLWMVLELSYCAYKLKYGIPCQLVNVSNDPYEMRIARVIWWYFMSKLFEFSDTLFFILRKKNNQLSFLHVYHHSSMFLVWWVAARFVPGGSSITPTLVNCTVHVVMYLYYGLAALGDRYKRYLWWKKYLTVMQLLQFMIGISFAIHMITTGCQFTRWMQYVFMAYAISFVVLFGNFYRHEYHVRPKVGPSSPSTSQDTQQLIAKHNKKLI
ncbi:Elongation of very long chain fatty acids protein 4, partial [Fragariocoptes setiger]